MRQPRLRSLRRSQRRSPNSIPPTADGMANAAHRKITAVAIAADRPSGRGRSGTVIAGRATGRHLTNKGGA